MAPSAISDLLPSPQAPLTSKSITPGQEHHEHGMEDKTPLAAISHGDVMLAGVPKFDSFAAQRQWQLEHMAAAFRHWAREGYVEGISGHISVRDPETHDVFWTNRKINQTPTPPLSSTTSKPTLYSQACRYQRSECTSGF